MVELPSFINKQVKENKMTKILLPLSVLIMGYLIYKENKNWKLK